MARVQWDRSNTGWAVGALMLALGQLMQPFVGGETVWSFDERALQTPQAGASVAHGLVTGFARV